MSKRNFNGPIPGSNYLADTKNYSWHRPPEVNTYDEGVEYFLERISDPERMNFYSTSLSMGLSIVDLTTYAMLQMIRDGIVTVDIGILIAGPIAKSLEMVAEGQGIDYERGWSQEPILLSPEMVRKHIEDQDPVEKEMIPPDLLESEEEEAIGLMAENETERASDTEQQEMLGNNEPPEEEEVA